MCRLCENEGVRMGLYRSGEGVYGSAIMCGFGRERILNLEVGEVFGEEWMDVNGEGYLGKSYGCDW